MKIEIDDREIRKFINYYGNTLPKRIMPKVYKGTLNDLAFKTKDNTKKTLDKNFKFKNSNTLRYLSTGVHVQKVRGSNPNTMFSIVGVKSGNEDTRKGYKRHILTRQEKGGVLKQVKANNSGYRKVNVVPTSQVDPKKKIVFSRGGVVSSPAGIIGNKRKMGAALSLARRKGKRYASTPFGIYKVFKTKAVYVRSYHPQGDIKTPKKSWLKPANVLTMKKRKLIFKKNLRRELKRANLL